MIDSAARLMMNYRQTYNKVKRQKDEDIETVLHMPIRFENFNLLVVQ